MGVDKNIYKIELKLKKDGIGPSCSTSSSDEWQAPTPHVSRAKVISYKSLTCYPGILTVSSTNNKL